MVRELKGKRPLRPRRPRKQLLPDAAVRTYRAALIEVLEEAKRLVDADLVPRLEEIERVAQTRVDGTRLDADGWQQRIRSIMAAIRSALGFGTRPEQTANDAAQETSRFNFRQVRAQLRSVLGIDVFFNEPRLQSALDDFAEQNVALIKTVPAKYFEDIERVVRSGFRSGRRASDISAELTERFNVAKSRADLIARDQINKLNANLTRDRQQALGIADYIWRTSRDERVRATHIRLEGTRQSWDNPPVVGSRRLHPGEDFRCRCTAEPIIPGAPEPIRTTPADVRR
jgi:SPP1 gp7 family putative phage head morphogenesis protein